jgi:hypothetical protein
MLKSKPGQFAKHAGLLDTLGDIGRGAWGATKGGLKGGLLGTAGGAAGGAALGGTRGVFRGSGVGDWASKNIGNITEWGSKNLETLGNIPLSTSAKRELIKQHGGAEAARKALEYTPLEDYTPFFSGGLLRPVGTGLSMAGRGTLGAATGGLTGGAAGGILGTLGGAIEGGIRGFRERGAREAVELAEQNAKRLREAAEQRAREAAEARGKMMMGGAGLLGAGYLLNRALSSEPQYRGPAIRRLPPPMTGTFIGEDFYRV